jgi:uncharacterized repeat protein (TIGR01451 family)
VVITEAPQPSLTLNKQVQTPGPFKVGDTVAYSYTVTNTGTNELHNALVRDNRITQITCDTTTLAPGARTTCHGNFTITRAVLPKKCHPAGKRAGGQATDRRNGCRITNTATATATTPTGQQATSPPATATITITTTRPDHHCKPHRHDGHKYRYNRKATCDHDN